MPPIIRGSEISGRLLKVTDIEATPSGEAWQAFHFYSENFQPGQGLVDDDELGGTLHNLVDPTKQAQALPNPTGQMMVPLDRNQLGFWLTSMWGAPTTTGSSPNYTHVWTSGGTAPGLLSMEFPTGPSFFRVADAFAVSSMALQLADEDGFRKADLGFVGRSVRPLESTLTASVTAAPARDKIAGSKGVLKVNSTNLGNVLGGSLSMGNGAFMERYLDDSEWPGAVEIGRPSAELSPQLRVRQGVEDLLALFDGVTAMAVELLYQVSSTQLLSFAWPQMIAAPLLPVSQGLGGMDITPSFRASQTGSAPMMTVTLKNTIASY